MSDESVGDIKRLLCLVGRHDYRWMRNVGNKSEIQCSRCGANKFVAQFTPDIVKDLNEWAEVDCNTETDTNRSE